MPTLWRRHEGYGMSQKEARNFDRKRIAELILAIEPAKNEHIAREAVDIASKWLIKAENQAAQIENLEKRAQRTRGEWIPQGWNDTYCKCSCCDAVYVTAEIPYSFCPNCGADMRGAANDD